MNPSASAGMAVLLVGGGAVLLWSGTPIANKIAVAHMDPMTAGVLRSMLAGLIALGIATAARLPRPRAPGHWGLLLGSGIASFAVWPMLLSLGLGRTTANHAALILAQLPLLTGLIAAAVDRRWPRRGWWAGMALAGVGTFFLVFYRSDGALLQEDGGLVGDLIILGGTVICAGGYVAGGRLSPVIGTWSTTFWGLAAALTVLIPTFLLRLPRTDWSGVGPAGWTAIAYLTILSSLLGYAAWFWALGRGGITRISSWQLLQPVLTVGLAAAFLGEAVTVPLLLSAAAILAGTALAQPRK
ncbi:MAG: DMT family transporter [Gemmatimonadetes bacterium]|nr:DMT family transporter [Gemmatimonadota bacterium]